ncbi:tyrosine-protein kinase domain-containing protein [Micrococcus luteus]|uniref:polysaccharide biosynthesis tyrosine autokinase n=1 Tax=Micrococcus luteus TaxID=1270 RepID=UPI000BF12D27|nr:polysaccharide biosynthesis tyrosine autokinase [Micrococcus luteus]PEH50706.1 chain length determinant protein [Micrococcus luteus]
MTVVDFLRLLRASLLTLLVATLVGGLLGWGYSAMQPRLYASESTGFLAPRSTENSVITGGLPGDSRGAAYLALINSPAVLDRVAQETGQDVSGQLDATSVDGSNLIKVTATSQDPQMAATLANSALQATADVAAEVDPNSPVEVVPLSDARAPEAPFSPNTLRNVLTGALAGLVVGVLLALLRRLMDVKVRHRSDVREITGAGVMGALPEHESLTQTGEAAVDLDPRAGEAVRQLRTNLKFVSVDHPPRVISLASPNPSEGKSTVAASLARALALAGERVLLVDADLRRPRQHELFQVSGDVGLSEVLAGQVRAEDALADTGLENLTLLPAGRTPPNPSELLGSERMRSLLTLAAQDYFVVVDGPPLLPVTDASLLATAADGTVLVVRQGKTRKDHLEAAVETLQSVDATLLGTVLNGVSPKQGGGAYGGYGYGYGAYGSSYHASHETYLQSVGSTAAGKKGRRRSKKG